MKDWITPAEAELRPPSDVMRLSRLGAMFPTRLSFLRTLMRRLDREGATLNRPVWQMNAEGHGHAVYTIRLGGHDYALVAVSNELDPSQRTDRVIATAWDAAFVLYDGVPDEAEVARIRREAPKQEAGRFGPRDLVLSRANKSVRLFTHVAEALRAGRQPDEDPIREIGYLMRTTAVYGNGKFGIADRTRIAARPGLDGPFMAEMLTVWMIRNFTHDLVSHVGGAPLEPRLRRHLGIGNATGLGMAPFLVTHPVLLNNWMLARETALARVRAVEVLTEDQKTCLRNLADTRVPRHLAEWQVPDPAHQARIEALAKDFAAFRTRHLTDAALARSNPIDRALRAAAEVGQDLEELVVALVLEPFPDLVDGLEECMADPLGYVGPGLHRTGALRDAIEDRFGWALKTDYQAPDACRRFWYVSAEKLEPRLGDRHAEPGAERESPLDVARRVRALYEALPDEDTCLTTFLATAPEHMMAVERVEIALSHPYSEIRDNLIAETCLPIDMLRAKLSLFGATRFDPKSDLWTRITLCQGAPLPEEMGTGTADDWWLPALAP
ncbi:hypothetical protein [Pseudaestuariivita atlantica]|uniref:Uncharacterized protein n=1 Tax=Pseudaestuariivita atlantica TaxID=1317121 RepID=A0A0L1JQU4_9RHOB|nr:hypothetical protein [Pseudaestuariivita atlantica]KNG94100.1 hypothetical protein ATO11_07605 [Pseudaestuariivita atlantica]